MREPPIIFRLPDHVRNNLDVLAARLNVSINIVAKLIVIREIMHIPAMLDEHDRQLANMHQFLRELAFRNEAFLLENSDRADCLATISLKLDEIMVSLDAIRDAAFVRPSSHITDMIRRYDERAVQKSFSIEI